MTEQEWLACTDPQEMLDFLHSTGKLSERKVRLFLSAHLGMAGASSTLAFRRQLASVLDRLADGLPGSEEALAAMIQELNETQWTFIERQYFEGAAYLRECADMLKLARRPDAPGARLVARWFDCPTLRDLFNNPVCPVSFKPSYLPPTIVVFAQHIYDHRSFDRLPILADALEEAGCDNADVLSHCRGPGPHTRGCWVVDAILGKT